jgi:hypothetical protein
VSSDAADTASLDKRALLPSAKPGLLNAPYRQTARRPRHNAAPNNAAANMATTDAPTLLLYNQHAICAAMETLDRNAQDITDAIMQIRQL